MRPASVLQGRRNSPTHCGALRNSSVLVGPLTSVACVGCTPRESPSFPAPSVAAPADFRLGGVGICEPVKNARVAKYVTHSHKVGLSVPVA